MLCLHIHQSLSSISLVMKRTEYFSVTNCPLGFKFAVSVWPHVIYRASVFVAVSFCSFYSFGDASMLLDLCSQHPGGNTFCCVLL